MSEIVALVLAAGQSRRMKSRLSKVLHPIAGRPLLHYPVRVAFELGATRVVVITSPKDEATIARYVASAFPGRDVLTAVQATAQGTGHAVRCGLERLGKASAERALILYGDVPLVTARELSKLAEPSAGLTMTTCLLDDPTGYGRIVRDASGAAVGIREHKDLTSDEERAIREINAGLYSAPLAPLVQAIEGLSNDNAQREYYLTDIVPYFAARSGVSTARVSLDAVRGVNDRVQLWEAQETMNERIVSAHRRAGASIGAGVWIDDAVSIGSDADIGAQCHLRGSTVLGERVILDVGCVLTDVTLEPGTRLRPYTVIGEPVPSPFDVVPASRR